MIKSFLTITPIPKHPIFLRNIDKNKSCKIIGCYASYGVTINGVRTRIRFVVTELISNHIKSISKCATL